MADGLADAVVVLSFSIGDTTESNQIILSRDQVAAALIYYCRNNRIPLPRQGRKFLQTQEDGVALMINVQWARKPPEK